MSKTDSTRPYWVQLRDPSFPYKLNPHHRCVGTHYARECDLDFPLPVTRGGRFGCEIWPKYRDNDKIYGRPRYRRSYKSFQDGRARADLRRLRNNWKKYDALDREDIDSNENLPSQRWLWRRWYWD